jgi:hypothetical protein
MPLCHSCEKFDIYSLWRRPRGSRDLRLRDLLDAANKCDFCSLLCEQFEYQISEITRISPCRVRLSLHDDADSSGGGSKFEFSSLFARLVTSDQEDEYIKPIDVQLRIVASQGIVLGLLFT